ncbi:hypothetical protein RDABS01_005287 [Bienertia sinuspersici]
MKNMISLSDLTKKLNPDGQQYQGPSAMASQPRMPPLVEPIHKHPSTTQIPHSLSYKDTQCQKPPSSTPLGPSDCLNDEDEVEPDDDGVDEGCPRIMLSREEMKRMRSPRKHSLINKMFDGKLGYMTLMRRLKRKWQLKGEFTLTDIGCDYFIARFSTQEDYMFFLTQGPWLIDDNFLTIRKWVPNFIPDNEPIKVLTAWVTIPHLPVAYFDMEFLKKVGSKIGKVLRVDQNMANSPA